MKKLITLLAVVVSCSFAQTAPPNNYFIGIGGGYNTAGYTNFTKNPNVGALITFGIQGGSGSNFWNITTLVTQPGSSGVSSIRTGIGYSIKKSGNFNLIALGDAGTTNTATSILGNVGGGLLLRYDLGGIIKPFKGQGWGIAAGVRLANISSQAVKPEYTLMVSKRF